MTLTRQTVIAYGMPGMSLAIKNPLYVLLLPAYARLPQLGLALIRSAFLATCTIPDVEMCDRCSDSS